MSKQTLQEMQTLSRKIYCDNIIWAIKKFHEIGRSDLAQELANRVEAQMSERIDFDG